MPDIDAQSLADQAVMLGLVTRAQAREAVADAEDGTSTPSSASFLRKGLLTSWQVERLQKGDPSGFFYGGCKVLFHLAEGTFARVYRGVQGRHRRPSPSRCSASGSSPTRPPSTGSTRRPRPA